MTTSCVLTDPAALMPSQWSARLAAYLSRGRGNDDPDATQDELGFKSVGAAQMAYRRFLARNPVEAAAFVRHLGALGLADRAHARVSETGFRDNS